MIVKSQLREQTLYKEKRHEYDQILKERASRLKKNIDLLQKREELF